MRRYWSWITGLASVVAILVSLREHGLPWLVRVANMSPLNIFVLAVGVALASLTVYLVLWNRRKTAKAISREVCDLIDYRSSTDPEKQKVEVLTRLEEETGMKLTVFQRGPRIVNKSSFMPLKETRHEQ